MRDELKISTHSATSDRETLQTHLQALTSDLKTTKTALDSTIQREKMVKAFEILSLCKFYQIFTIHSKSM